MAVIKCKMCGGDLELIEGSSVCECEYCGTKQTVPIADNEKKLTLFARANRLRAANEFDKAAGVYESIVADFPEEAEAYWGLVLCRYGIEYVDDPATGKKIPTCHRSSFDSVLKDSDFDQACENADAVARRQYREEAKQIEDIRRRIIEVSGKEEPYDIFICYKETDENGERTIDSVLAQDVYDALTDKGYRVFFSRVSLEDKLGTEYEPYIFAALNSAKVMLAFGTDFEYYNAVWVKNEWSRFLKLMAKDKSKHLIPCYKNLDPYDIPDEFQRLQAQDLGKVGAVQDLLRGIEKILSPKTNQPAEPVVQQVIQGGGPNVTALLQRGQMALEDREWDSARNYFDQALNMDAQSAEAYLGLLLADMQISNTESLLTLREGLGDITENTNYKKFKRIADAARAKHIDAIIEEAKHIAWEAKRPQEEKRRLLAPIRTHIAAVGKVLFVGSDCTMGVNSDGAVVACGGKMVRDIGTWTNISAVSAGKEHAVGLKTDGTVIACGHNKFGQCNVGAWSHIVAVATGSTHTVGLRSDGTVVACGGKMVCDVGAWRDVIAIASAPFRTVGLKADGTVVACGINFNGECDVGDWTDIVAVVAGDHHTVGLKVDGTVVACGSNPSVECDVGDWTDIIAVVAGYSCTVGLKSDGTVVADRLVGDPTEFGLCSVEKWVDIVAITAGGFHAVGLKADGTVVAFGDNYNGQCNVGAWTDIVAVFAGDNHTVGLKSDGTVVACGANENGQCNVENWKLFRSLDTLEEERKEARERVVREAWEAIEREMREAEEANKAIQARLALVKKADMISCGGSRTVGLKADGTVVTVGGYSHDGHNAVSEWEDIVSVSANELHILGLKKDGSVVAVGFNEDGICYVDHWKSIVAISAGSCTSVGLKADGTVVSMGYNIHGQCNVGAWNQIVAVSAGGTHTVGLKSDGTVVAVGANNVGQCNVSDWKDIVAISAGSRHTVGLKRDGTVVAVGANDRGQCNISRWLDIVVISAGTSHTVGLKADGTVVVVGDSGETQCDVLGWKEIVAVSANGENTVGLRADGSVVAVGNNNNGQCNVSDWKLFDYYASIETQTIEAERRDVIKRVKKRAEEERKALQDELVNLKGFFSGKRRKEIEARLKELTEELNKLNQ